jgi:hypothetical protein
MGIEGWPAAMAGPAKGPEQPVPNCRLGKVKRAFSEAIETISRECEACQRVRWKKDGSFERKYDMSIPGNIYISIPHIVLAVRAARTCAIKLTYKAIY